MTPSHVVSTSQQIHDYLLCAECKHRLNVGGEQYIYAVSFDGKKFPLKDRLASGTPVPIGPYLRYSGQQVGVDVENLVYFAVSMVWRDGVHSWKTIGDCHPQLRDLRCRRHRL